MIDIEFSKPAMIAIDTMPENDRKAVLKTLKLLEMSGGDTSKLPNGKIGQILKKGLYSYKVNLKLRLLFEILNGRKKIVVVDIVNHSASKRLFLGSNNND